MNHEWIDFRLWRQFAVLARELHFGRAAARLHMTQPPLTQAIAQLERQLGAPLFARTSRKVALTPLGRQLLPEVDAMLQQARRLPQLAQALADGSAGELRLAFVSTAGYEIIPRWVRWLRKELPQLRLRLQEATGDQQLTALRLGELDAGLILHSPGALPAELQALRVQTEALYLAVPARHALARQPATEPLPASLLADVPLVCIPRHILPALHDGLREWYAAQGLGFAVVQEAIQMQTLVNLVSAGLGVAWVPGSVRAFRRAGVVYRQVAAGSAPLPTLECSLVWHQDQRAPALERLCEMLLAG